MKLSAAGGRGARLHETEQECPRVSDHVQGSPSPGVWALGAGVGGPLPAGTVQVLSTRGGSTFPHACEGRSPTFPQKPWTEPWAGQMVIRGGAGRHAGRHAGLEQGALPLCYLERRALTGPWSESQTPQDVPGGTEGLHGAWGWAEGCLEVTWIGPSSGRIVL